ncbi:MAG: acyl-CoA reductase [Myxococcota bacterium]
MSDLESLRKRQAELTPDRVLSCLDRALSAWRDPGSKVREQLRAKHPVFSPEVVDLGCDLGLRQWTRASLDALRAREIPALYRAPTVTAVWLAGCVPTASFAAIVYPLLVGSAVYVKPSAADPVSPGLFRESLLDADPAVGEAVALGTDAEVLREADAVVVHGSDETVSELRARVPVDRIFIGYGHKVSISAIGQGIGIETAARDLGRDITLYDGRGCLSPAWVLVENTPSGRSLEFARALGKELARLASALPPGRLHAEEHAWVHDRRARATLREGTTLLSSDGTAWSVILEAVRAPCEPGMLRTVPVVPVATLDDLGEWCSRHAPHLSSVGHAGWGTRTAQLGEIVALCGASRLCGLGNMQVPPIDWNHDGLGPLSALIRRVDVETAQG